MRLCEKKTKKNKTTIQFNIAKELGETTERGGYM